MYVQAACILVTPKRPTVSLFNKFFEIRKQDPCNR